MLSLFSVGSSRPLFERSVARLLVHGVRLSENVGLVDAFDPIRRPHVFDAYGNVEVGTIESLDERLRKRRRASVSRPVRRRPRRRAGSPRSGRPNATSARPTTMLAGEVHGQSTASAISAGRPSLPIGTSFTIALRASVWPTAFMRSLIDVSNMPGQAALTLMPLEVPKEGRSRASVRSRTPYSSRPSEPSATRH